VNISFYTLYGSYPNVFVTQQTTPILSNKTKVCFILDSYTYMHATCFGLYLGHPHTSQYTFLFYLPFYGFHIDKPEGGLSTDRNM